MPLISVHPLGEGGSGGAVALPTAERLAMLEHSFYLCDLARGCASIAVEGCRERWREAAEALP